MVAKDVTGTTRSVWTANVNESVDTTSFASRRSTQTLSQGRQKKLRAALTPGRSSLSRLRSGKRPAGRPAHPSPGWTDENSEMLAARAAGGAATRWPSFARDRRHSLWAHFRGRLKSLGTPELPPNVSLPSHFAQNVDSLNLSMAPNTSFWHLSFSAPRLLLHGRMPR